MFLQAPCPTDRCHCGRIRADRDTCTLTGHIALAIVRKPEGVLQVLDAWGVTGRSVQPITLGTTVAPDRIFYGKGLGGEQGSSTRIVLKQNVDAFIDHPILSLLISDWKPVARRKRVRSDDQRDYC